LPQQPGGQTQPLQLAGSQVCWHLLLEALTWVTLIPTKNATTAPMANILLTLASTESLKRIPVQNQYTPETDDVNTLNR
jgi:hypothetical protein